MTTNQVPVIAAPGETSVASPVSRSRAIALGAGIGGALLMLASAGTTWLQASKVAGDGYTLSRLPSLDATDVSVRYLVDGGALRSGWLTIGNVLLLIGVSSLLAMFVARLRVLAVVCAVAGALLTVAFVLRVADDMDALRTAGADTRLLGFLGAGVYLAAIGSILVGVAYALLRRRELAAP